MATMCNRTRIAPWLLAVLLCAPVACEPQRSERGGIDGPMRVVSLSPALTQMVVDLKATGLLVAVAENDAAAPAGLPTVGNFINIDREALLAASPTHVLMMTGKEGVPAHLASLARTQGFRLCAYAYPDSIVDVGNILCGPDDSVSAVLLRQMEGLELRETGFYLKLGRIDELVGERDRPRVLLVINLNPLMASGRQTVLNDVLLFMLKGDNAAEDLTGSAPILDREMLLQAAPDVVLLLIPGEPPLRAVAEDPRLAIFRGLDIPAVTNDRIVLIDDPLVLLPSTSLVRVGIAMAKAIHPDVADRIAALAESADSGERAGQP